MAFPEKKPFTPQRPQQGGTRPTPGGTRPTAPGSRPSAPGVRPTVGGARPATGNSGTRPSGTGSAGAGARPGARDQRMVYINELIKAPKVLIIDEDGSKSDIVSRDEALRRAFALGLDLVQIAYNPVDMVCTAKIVDYGKYMYDKSKDDKERKKNQKSKGGKDIKMSYTIGDNDLGLKVRNAIEFLQDGYTVRFIVKLKGREKIFVDKMIEKLSGVDKQLQDYGKSQGVKQEPNGVSLFLLPKAK